LEKIWILEKMKRDGGEALEILKFQPCNAAPL
jgi:hypothetical protein